MEKEEVKKNQLELDKDKIRRNFSGCLMRCTHSVTIQLKGKRR